MATALPASKESAGHDLLERSDHLGDLAEALATVAQRSRGRLVFIAGEAGVGKTALLNRFCDDRGAQTRILWGACDSLFTPRPLGPFVDIAEQVGGELAQDIAKGARPHEVAATLLRELGTRSPTILVIEDLHWADEATLDIVRLLSRKVDGAPILVLASYRDDELPRGHPLRLVLGDGATRHSVERMTLAPLSFEAVAMLAEPFGVDAGELYDRTGGNPFFVTEVLASADSELPHTVRDAVLARAARLSAPALTLIEAVAVVPPEAELWLLEALAGEAVEHFDECVSSGVLRLDGDRVFFRHELARLAVEESLPPNRRVALHRKALAALAEPPAGAPDLPRLAHHAEAAGDAEAVLRFAPAAATRAASLGSHREAVDHYARALRSADRLQDDVRANLLERYSGECYVTDQSDEAIQALEGALECYRALGDRRKEGDCLRRLSEILWCPGRAAESQQAGREAVAVLEELPPGRELALAYTNLSGLSMSAEDPEETRAWGTRALELGQHLDDVEIIAETHIILGSMAWLTGAPEGRDQILLALELAEEAGLEGLVGTGFAALAKTTLRQRSHPLADAAIEDGLAYCTERGLDLFRLYLLAYRARSELGTGRWADAVESAELVLREPRTSTLPRIHALVVIALVRARRGDPGYRPPLDEAQRLAEGAYEPQRIGPVAAARAEVSWLEGNHESVAAATEDAFELSKASAWVIGELASWRRRAGVQEEIPPAAAEPYALGLAGEWERSAELWDELGCPYEAALSLLDGDEDALRRAHARLQKLGAVPAAAIVAQRLRERGVRGIPRGPRASTLSNPGNLTEREVEVLALVAQGLANAEIGERLFLSSKTVDHHVSAILRKLGVRTRAQASAEAVRLGLAGQDR